MLCYTFSALDFRLEFMEAPPALPSAPFLFENAGKVLAALRAIAASIISLNRPSSSSWVHSNGQWVSRHTLNHSVRERYAAREVSHNWGLADDVGASMPCLVSKVKWSSCSSNRIARLYFHGLQSWWCRTAKVPWRWGEGGMAYHRWRA